MLLQPRSCQTRLELYYLSELHNKYAHLHIYSVIRRMNWYNIKFYQFLALEPLDDSSLDCWNCWNSYVPTVIVISLYNDNRNKTNTQFLWIIGFCSIIIYFSRTNRMYVMYICVHICITVDSSERIMNQIYVHKYDSIKHPKSLVWHYMFIPCMYLCTTDYIVWCEHDNILIYQIYSHHIYSHPERNI